MNKLSHKIRSAFIFSISAISVCVLIILFINQINVFQNQSIIKTMTMEYSIISLSDNLAQSYNDVVKNPGNTQISAQYNSLHTKLLETLNTLKSRVTKPDSQVLLLGVDSTVNQVINECDQGLQEIQNNNFNNSSNHFTQALKYNVFVADNTRNLLQKELEFLSTTQASTQQTYMYSIIISLGVLILTFIISIFYAHSFSQKLISPLVNLSVFAQEIASGNLKSSGKRTQIITEDEIGSLTNSIYTMVDKLVEMINREQKIRDQITKSNTELQTMNTFMVDRELKMIELKNEIARLTKAAPKT